MFCMGAWTNPVTDSFGPLGPKHTGRGLTQLTCMLLFTRSNISSLCAFHSSWMSSHPFLRICRVLILSVIAILRAVYAVLERRCIQ